MDGMLLPWQRAVARWLRLTATENDLWLWNS